MSKSSGATIEERLTAISKGAWEPKHNRAAVGRDDMLVSPVYDTVMVPAGIADVKFHCIIVLHGITLHGTGATGLIYVPESLPDSKILLKDNRVTIVRDPWQGLASFAKIR